MSGADDSQSAPSPHLWRGDLRRIDHPCIRVPDLKQGVNWYRSLLTLVEAGRMNGRVYLASPASGRIVLVLAEGGTGLDYVSFQVDGNEGLSRIGARLESARIPLQACTPRMGAREAHRFELPTGQSIELLISEDEGVFAEPSYAAHVGCLDARPAHVQLRAPDVSAIAGVLSNVGFKVTEYVRNPSTDGYLMQFLRINEYHHQIAVLTGRAGLHHVAIEIDYLDFPRLGDHLARLRIPAEYGPGRHASGQIMFLYIRDPFGNRVEINSPMHVVGFDRAPKEPRDPPWYAMNMWGPAPPQSWYTEWT